MLNFCQVIVAVQLSGASCTAFRGTVSHAMTVLPLPSAPEGRGADGVDAMA
jgi:hypothetical protein